MNLQVYVRTSDGALVTIEDHVKDDQLGGKMTEYHVRSVAARPLDAVRIVSEYDMRRLFTPLAGFVFDPTRCLVRLVDQLFKTSYDPARDGYDGNEQRAHDLESALDEVLSRYGLPMRGYPIVTTHAGTLQPSTGPERGDRGDLVSDLADAARKVDTVSFPPGTPLVDAIAMLIRGGAREGHSTESGEWYTFEHDDLDQLAGKIVTEIGAVIGAPRLGSMCIRGFSPLVDHLFKVEQESMATLTRFQLHHTYRHKVGGGLIQIVGAVPAWDGCDDDSDVLVGLTPAGTLHGMTSSRSPGEYELTGHAEWQEAWDDPRYRDMRGESTCLVDAEIVDEGSGRLGDGSVMSLRDFGDARTVRGESPRFGSALDEPIRSAGDARMSLPGDSSSYMAQHDLTIEQHALAHDDRGASEEMCTRCGWVMGHPPLNCQNDNSPHVFPSQLSNTASDSDAPSVRQLHATTDAQTWAREFMRTVNATAASPAVAIDEGFMIGWFANAIETARRIEQESPNKASKRAQL